MSDIDVVLDRLLNEILAPTELVQGCSDSEIAEVIADQEVGRLPSAYLSYLKRIGRGAGRLLVGTHAFYPQILGLKAATAELFVEDGVSIQLGPQAFVIAMHQGYQAFWFPTVIAEDPEVLMFQEGDQGPARKWGSFSVYLNDMVNEIA